MEDRTRAQLIAAAASWRAAERAAKIVAFDAVTTGRATKSQIHRHVGIARSTIDAWLRQPEAIAEAKLWQTVHELGLTPLPSQADRDAGRAPEDAPRGIQVWVLIRAGWPEQPGEAVHRGRLFVGDYRPSDAEKLTETLCRRLAGQVTTRPGVWTVHVWVDEVPAFDDDDPIPF